MPDLVNFHQPSINIWPLQNARTGYQPVWLPAILVIPHVRADDGSPVTNAGVFDVIFRIEEAPGRAKVAGYLNRGIFIPELERYRVEVSALQLYSHRLDMSGLEYEDSDGNAIDYSEAVEGDFVYITTQRGDLRDKIEYLPHADYYDLSPVFIETYDLKPTGQYVVSWCAHYYHRVVTGNDELYCIDVDRQSLARQAFLFDHPGEIHDAMTRWTPGVYFDGTRYDQDNTIKFYRPFADALQDVFDEIKFVESVNWVDRVPSYFIPYLAYMLGWELPYFPGATEEMRRTFLSNARRLQELKGSKRAIRELFEIFNYTVDILNVWYRKDGLSLVGIDETAEITSSETCQVDVLLHEYDSNGFGGISVPLLHRPISSSVTVEAWHINKSTHSALYDVLVEQADILIRDEICATDPNGYIISSSLHTALPVSSVIGYSRIKIDLTNGRGTQNVKVGEAPLNVNTVTYDSYRNELELGFDHYLDFGDDEVLFVFATYGKNTLTIDPDLADLQSNRFDVRILEDATGEEVDSDTLEFLIDYIFKLKPFHSLLRKIIFTVNLSSAYGVLDFCVGGDISQRADIDAGELQVPPAVIPVDDECTEDAWKRGFKDEDIKFRNDLIVDLEYQFQGWKRLDDAYIIDDATLAQINSLSAITVTSPDADDSCQLTSEGQDKQFTDDNSTACDTSQSIRDYCYKGRVSDGYADVKTIPVNDLVRCKPCLGMGYGYYYMIPSNPTPISPYYAKLGTIDKVLQYTDREKFTLDMVNPAAFPAIVRPGLDIDKDNLHFPGHRFIRMNALESDYNVTQSNANSSVDYSARPWDEIFFNPCAGETGWNTLNTEIVIGTDGDEYYEFDNVDLIIPGNGLTPDIPTLGDHSSSANADYLVTHSIYSSADPPHEAVTEGDDDIIVYTSELIGTGETPPDVLCIPEEIGPIFESADQ